MLDCPIKGPWYLELACYFEFNFKEIYRVLKQCCLVSVAGLWIRSSMIDDVIRLITVYEARLAFQSKSQISKVKLVVSKVLDPISKDHLKVH